MSVESETLKHLIQSKSHGSQSWHNWGTRETEEEALVLLKRLRDRVRNPHWQYRYVKVWTTVEVIAA